MNENSSPATASSGVGVVDEKGISSKYNETTTTSESPLDHEDNHEKNGLRIYGDDEDHDIEPKVYPTFPSHSSSLTSLTDVLQAHDVLGRHGLPLDWISNSCLSFWLVILSR
jgi:hypothetical protein